jgi:hypothetical protein
VLIDQPNVYRYDHDSICEPRTFTAIVIELRLITDFNNCFVSLLVKRRKNNRRPMMCSCFAINFSISSGEALFCARNIYVDE